MTEIKAIAYRFRTAIEKAIEAGESESFFRKFPTGQCGHTTDMLIQYLLDLGYQHVIYVNGTYYGNEWDDRWSHTWLELDGIIVDITGDQFKHHPYPLKNDVPIFVGPPNDWYRLFDTEHGSYHEHNGLEKSWINYSELLQWYAIIMQYM